MVAKITWLLPRAIGSQFFPLNIFQLEFGNSLKFPLSLYSYSKRCRLRRNDRPIAIHVPGRRQC